VFNPPKEKDKCDVCGSELYQRRDDTDDVIKVRFEVYKKETYPLMDYYSKTGKLVKVDGSKDVKEVFRSVMGSVA
jgi:adenylate kinase